jgi:hypothetical protein
MCLFVLVRSCLGVFGCACVFIFKCARVYRYSYSLGVLSGMVECVSTCVYSCLCVCTADGNYVLLLLFSVIHYVACADLNMSACMDPYRHRHLRWRTRCMYGFAEGIIGAQESERNCVFDGTSACMNDGLGW